MKRFILDNCLTVKGGLNNRVTLESWWVNKGVSDIRDRIIIETSNLHTPSFSERLYNIVNAFPAHICSCGKETSFNSYKDGYYKFCSTYCSTQDADRNTKIHLNRDYPTEKEKAKATNQKRYGVDWYFQTEEQKLKAKQTKIERYGDANFSNPAKTKITNMERYGVEYAILSPLVKKKSDNSIRQRNPSLWDAEWLQSTNQSHSISEMADMLGVTHKTILDSMRRLDVRPKFFPSKFNKTQGEILEFIDSLFDGEIRYNDRRVIPPKELDIYIPDLSLAIEFNGIYWHSYDHSPDHEEKYRHLTKHDLCREKGIRLIQIWDIEWIEKQTIIKDIIRRAIGKTENVVQARKTVIKTISQQMLDSFLNTNHVQGSINSKIRYGLFSDDELIAVMSFGWARFNKNHEYELLRYAQRCNYHVVGGSEKLFKKFIRDVPNSSVVSYSDRRLFVGDIYTRLGFSNAGSTDLDYFWVKKNMMLSRYETQKKKLHKLLGDGFDPTLTENQNMFNNGYRKLYSCGHNIWSR